MTLPNASNAETLRRDAHRVAAAASEHLLAQRPEIGKRFRDDPLQHWKEHFVDRVIELSESVAASEPRIFSAYVQWAQQAMASRALNTDYLNATLESLRAGIEEVLPSDNLTPVIDCFDQALDMFDADSNPTWQSELDPGLAHDRLALRYIQMVISGNVWLGMQVVLDALSEGFEVRDIYLRVLLPAQKEIGRLWHLNEVTVAEEHLVSSTTQRLMAVLANQAVRKRDKGYTAVATAVAGNAHDIGIRAIAYLLEFEGWRTIFLGSDMPSAELPATIQCFDADLVLLSSALSTQLRTLKQTVQDIRQTCDPNIRILIGGNGLRGLPGFWREIGADGYAQNAEEALERASELVVSSAA